MNKIKMYKLHASITNCSSFSIKHPEKAIRKVISIIFQFDLRWFHGKEFLCKLTSCCFVAQIHYCLMLFRICFRTLFSSICIWPYVTILVRLKNQKINSWRIFQSLNLNFNVFELLTLKNLKRQYQKIIG